jgi:EAL domain-containing protein (putative c-di-GMP-specific phosphodiesterase class I)
MAMYEAKSMDGSNYRFFTDQMNNEALDQSKLEIELRQAMTNNELKIFYQPRISFSTGKIVGIESLLRWNHPTRGLLAPQQFISHAKQLGLISPIGYWSLEQICRDIQSMRKLNISPINVSFNVAYEQFIAPKFVNTVEEIISSNNINGDHFEFELAENDFVSKLADLSDDMLRLEKLGIYFSLDDFGTGSTSLTQLQKLPIKTIKLDKSHVQKVTTEKDSANIVKAMIDLAHGLKLKVVAEGVETEKQKTFLSENNCDQMQGYLYSKPLEVNDLIKLLKQDGFGKRASHLTIVDK